MASVETLILEIIARDKNASAAFDNLRRSVDGSTTSVDKNSQSLDKNTQSQKSLIGTAIGVGTAFSAMSSPIASAGAGILAFGTMAAPSIMALSTAMSKPGGLQANMMLLDATQQKMAGSVLALQDRYHGLAKAMEPQDAQIFGTALGIVNGALGPFSQLAANAGRSLEGFLVQFSQQSGLNEFITFMAHEAGPAIRLLGTDITNISHAVFQLLQSWGGLGLAELKLVTTVITGITGSLSWLAEHVPAVTGIGVAIGGIALALSKLGLLSGVLKITGLAMVGSEAFAAAKGMTTLSAATRAATAAQAGFDAITPAGWIVLAAAAVGTLAFMLDKADKAEQDLINTTVKNTQAQGFNTAGFAAAAHQLDVFSSSIAAQADAALRGRAGVNGLGTAYRDLTQQSAKWNQGVQEQNLFLARLETQYGLTRDQAVALAKASGVQVDKNAQLTDGFRNSVREADRFANANEKARVPVMGMAAAVTDLTAQLDKQVTAVLTLQGDELAWRSAMLSAKTQLDSNSAGLKGNSAAAIANKQAVLGTTSAAIAFAKEQLTAKSNLSGASDQIRAQIGFLRSLHDQSGFTSAEIKVLVGWLRQVKSEQATIKVTGTGSYNILGVPGTHPIIRPAKGTRVPGYGGGDRWPALLEGGEAVVPKHLVPDIAPYLKAHGVPGFAAGGVAGTYGDGVPGLTGWLKTENTATLTAIENATAQAILAALRAAVPVFPGGGGGGPGGPVEALMRQMAAARGWTGVQWTALNAVEMREAGYNLTAQNPTSPAYGLAQFIGGPSEYYQWGGNPFTAAGQITGMLNYIASRYTVPTNAWAHELSAGWYDQGGALPPGLSLAYNGTGRPEPVGGGDVVINLTVNAPPLTDPAAVGRECVKALQAVVARSGPIRLKVRS